MSNRLTWTRPNGDWGIKGVDLTALPPNAYGALCKLKHMEDLVEQLADPKLEAWLREDLMLELLGCPPKNEEKERVSGGVL